MTVYAEPDRPDALALWCATLGLWVLRAPQVTVSYAQASLTADVYTQVAATLTQASAWCAAGLCPGEALLHREGGQPLTLAVVTRDAEPSPMVAPIAQAARQALAGEPVPVLPAVM